MSLQVIDVVISTNRIKRMSYLKEITIHTYTSFLCVLSLHPYILLHVLLMTFCVVTCWESVFSEILRLLSIGQVNLDDGGFNSLSLFKGIGRVKCFVCCLGECIWSVETYIVKGHFTPLLIPSSLRDAVHVRLQILASKPLWVFMVSQKLKSNVPTEVITEFRWLLNGSN